MKPEDLFEQARADAKEVSETAVAAVRHFIEREDEPFLFEDAVAAVEEETGAGASLAAVVVSHLASDGVDPLVHTTANRESYVVVAEYVPGDWWYGYKDFDDVEGPARRVVCRQCVVEEERAEEVAALSDPDAGYDELSERLYEKHFSAKHPNTDPAGVPDVIGASLATGTTIASNTAWHDGNVAGGTNVSVSSRTVAVSPQGSGSGLNADTVDGQHAADL